MSRLGFALSLRAVRYLGFCPEDLTSAPKHALCYVGQQVGAPPDAIARYGLRDQTRSDHLRAIYEHGPKKLALFFAASPAG